MSLQFKMQEQNLAELSVICEKVISSKSVAVVAETYDPD